MAFRYCNHIKTDGIQCHSPAKRDGKYCYYHSLYRRRVVPTKETPGTIQIPVIDRDRNLVNVDIREPYAQRYRLGALEDGAALQVAISTVVNALADNRLDLGRASTLLYGLQLASTNLRTFQMDDAAAAGEGGSGAAGEAVVGAAAEERAVAEDGLVGVARAGEMGAAASSGEVPVAG